MSDKTMWFGNRNYMQWIPCPQVGADYAGVGFGQGGTFLHGGSHRKQTFNVSRSRRLTWPLDTRDALRPITDYVEGVYGDGAIYWLDPFDMDQNAFAQSFATPSLGGKDGIVLSGSKTRPQLVQTAANQLGYPTQSALYTLNAATDKPFRHWIPIPSGYTAWVGVHGLAGSGGVVYAGTTNGPVASGSGAALTILPVTSTTRVTNSFTASSTVSGIEVWLGGTGTITLSGMMVQILPTGTAPTPGGFISGQGHSGMSYNGYPEKNAYSAAIDLVGLTASFIETEQWQ